MPWTMTRWHPWGVLHPVRSPTPLQTLTPFNLQGDPESCSHQPSGEWHSWTWWLMAHCGGAGWGQGRGPLALIRLLGVIHLSFFSMCFILYVWRQARLSHIPMCKTDLFCLWWAIGECWGRTTQNSFCTKGNVVLTHRMEMCQKQREKTAVSYEK